MNWLKTLLQGWVTWTVLVAVAYVLLLLLTKTFSGELAFNRAALLYIPAIGLGMSLFTLEKAK